MDFEENIFYEQAEQPDIFLVTVVENPSAERCKLAGDYEFHVNTMNFAVVDKTTKKPLYIWPFRYVRRYGRSETNYQFEAGRKCPSGEGLFSFLTKANDGDKIFQIVQKRFAEIKQRDHAFYTGVPQPKTSQRGPSPNLPPRAYSEKSSTPSKSQKPLPLPSAKPKLPRTPSIDYQNIDTKDSRPAASSKNALLNDIILKHKKTLKTPTVKTQSVDGDQYGECAFKDDSVNTYSEAANSYVPQQPSVNTGPTYDDNNTYDEVGY